MLKDSFLTAMVLMAAFMVFFQGRCAYLIPSKQILYVDFFIYFLSLTINLISDLSSIGGVQAWTYIYSRRPSRKWFEASQWCQKQFTRMVAFQSQEETDFLNNLLPYNPKYYWTGIVKKDGAWISDETGNEVPEQVQNWSPMEPDNFTSQDCVEIYIKRGESEGKWNNENCEKRKGAICYKGKALWF